MKKVINKKILPWLLFSCFSYLPIAAACSSNQATKVVNQQSENDKSDKTNQPSGMNGLFGMGDDAQKGEQPSTTNSDGMQTNAITSQVNQSEKAQNQLSEGNANTISQHANMEQHPPMVNHQGSEESTRNNDDQSPIVDESESEDDALTLSPTKFSDLQNLKTTISVENTNYQHLQPKVALEQIKHNLANVTKLFQDENHLETKYKITIRYDEMTFPDQINGEIKDLIADIQLNQQYQTVRFNLTNLKQQPISQQLAAQHQKFLTKKANLSATLKGLFPSFLASMLYYADNIPKANHPESGTLKLDYYSFLNHNTDLLRLDGLNINHSLLSQFFNYQPNDYEYVTKVVGIKFDDLNGTLGLKILISPAEGNNYDNSEYEEEFEFDGFRHLDLYQPEQNVLSFSLPTDSLATILQTNRDIQALLKQYQKTTTPLDLIAQLNQEGLNPSQVQYLSKQIEQNLVWNIDDDTNAIYYSTYPDNSLRLSALRAIQRNFGVYPFYTNYSFNELFDHLSLKLEPVHGEQESKLALSFQVRLPVFVIDYYSTINDLHTSVNQYLVLPVSSTIALTDALKPA